MKIKTTHSALKNKIFLGFWFILFAGIILFTNWIFRLPAQKAEELKDLINDTETNITRLTSLHAEYLLKNDKEDNLFITTGNNAEFELDRIILIINENLAAIRSSKVIALKASSALDQFSASLTDFESGMNNLVLITNERGNKNKGIVNQWMTLSRNMINASEKNNAIIRGNLSRIDQLGSEYLLNRDMKALEEISILAEEVRNNLSMEEGIAINDIDRYIVLTGNLVSIEKRMGHNNTIGIIPDLENSIKRLPSDFAALRVVTDDLLGKNLLYWNISRRIVILVFIVLFIMAFIKYFALIDPLKRLAEYSSKLSRGEFPSEKLVAGNQYDMKEVVNSLRSHVSSLKDKLSFTQALNQGNLDQLLSLSGQQDTLGAELISLQKKILENNMQQARNDEDNTIRRYMNEGLAKFADVLRTKNSGINMLGEAFIREIVKYLNALQGGLFIYDDTNPAEPVLNLVSSFAYNRKKYLQQSVKMGEGLVGSCAREKQYMNLTEIPEGYITITSGLGDTPPNNLLLIPVIHEKEILGVVEIASLHKFRNHEIEFAQEVAYSLGSTLVATRNNQRTAELLEKSQQQALEMAEQEEEMRQNMEELKATQEESIRREEELSGITQAVNQSLMIVEYNLDGRIQNVNEKMCHFIGRDLEEIVGKLHHEVFAGSLETDTAFWIELQQKGNVVVSENIKIGKKTFPINEHFARICNHNNDTVKFINFASNGRVGNS